MGDVQNEGRSVVKGIEARREGYSRWRKGALSDIKGKKEKTQKESRRQKRDGGNCADKERPAGNGWTEAKSRISSEAASTETHRGWKIMFGFALPSRKRSAMSKVVWGDISLGFPLDTYPLPFPQKKGWDSSGRWVNEGQS